MKNRKLITAALAAAMLFGAAASASAHEEGDRSNAANNQTQCDKAGGEFSVVDGVKTCTVRSEGEPETFDESGNSGNGWATATDETAVIEKSKGPGEVVEVEVLESCYNPGGKQMKPGSGKCP